ncbi:hypothetical protein LOTGIDRAFT_236614 [Lottia gigantea]|uniref:Uncharacterized protein n=1 Tax=Lottia gigantea TaxID=225164 RepID=V3ZR23_LOTGI|nr:hypothetical protein LOTGIDRAFT_236614 [Lottia gigantea]ESO83326.1 hypothetical protein LOTGIDRAFT_236614 [Lottia gigantea]
MVNQVSYCLYYLVIIRIQGGESKCISIRAHPKTVSQGEEYAVTCQTIYSKFWFQRNNHWAIGVANGTCDIPKSRDKKYKCESYREGGYLIVKLKVLSGEKSPQTVQWNCFYLLTSYKIRSEVLNITIRPTDPSKRTNQQTTSSTQTTSTKQSPRQSDKILSTRSPLSSPSSSSSSKDPQTVTKPPTFRSPAGKLPISSTNNNNLIALNCVVGVLVLINTMILVMFLYNKRKQDRAKQGPSKPLALEPRGLAESNYDDLDRTMDDGHTYDTAQAEVV